MAPGSTNRNTGTVPKARSRNNNGVPQEIVNPTRRDRDLQQLNVLADWASSYPSHTNNNSTANGGQTGGVKPQNRTPGEGTCFEFDNNRFIPVRPILRRNVLSDDDSQQHQHQQQQQQNQQQQAVGVVLPSGPIFQAGSPLSLRIPDGSSVPTSVVVTKNQAASNRNRKNNLEERLNQIQEYIQITTSLINSVQGEQRFGEDYENLVKAHSDLLNREKILKDMNSNTFKPINSSSLDDVTVNSDSESNGARPQSVQSIHSVSTSTPVNTPSIDDLKNKLDHQSRNMQSLKDQQNQLLRLHHAAKQQLQDLEQVRSTAYLPDFNNVETVEQAQSNVASLMSRMNAITSFIQNQNELCNLLGDDGDDVVAEQVALQGKLRELRNKKQQMEQLVHELQNMNDEASQSFAENDLTPTRIVPVDVERIVPIEMTNAPSRNRLKNKPIQNHVNGSGSDAESVQDAAEADMSGDQRVQEAATALSDKISEINAMKDQLKRLKDMMETVSLIEQKVGPEEEEDEEEERSRSSSVASQVSEIQRHQEIPEREKTDALCSMTEAIKEQTRQITIEKEKLRNAQAEIKRRSQALGDSTRLPKPVIPPRPVSPGPKERQQAMLKAELVAKKKELDKIEALMGQRKRAAEAYKVNPLTVNTGVAPDPPTRARFATPPQQVNTASKESADSGAGDLYTAPMEVPSSAPSDSTRSLHTVPPMPDIRTNWKRPVDHSLGSSTTDNFGVGSTHHSPWLPHFNGPPSSTNVGPQSPPSFGYIGSDHLTYNPFNFCPPPFNTNAPGNDPLVMQMLMNSITQCNQLLWIQQREINNLNNAVLLLQERILSSGANNLLQQQENINLQSFRAESTPPNPPSTMANAGSSYSRARSEQPHMQMPYSLPPNLPPIYQSTQATHFQSAAATQSSATSQQIQRNNHTMNINNRNVRNVRGTATNSNVMYENAGNTGNAYQASAEVHHQANSFMNLNNHIHESSGTGGEHEGSFQRHQNNVTASSTNASSNLTYQNLLNNNQMYTPQPQQTQATLNNQVPPGVRANNYWDNFRSYSRQNLLSSNSCKSNEDAHHTHNSNNVERERIPQNMTRNINSNANNNMHDNANVKYFNRNNSNNSSAATNILNHFNAVSNSGTSSSATAVATISPMTVAATPSTSQIDLNQEITGQSPTHFNFQNQIFQQQGLNQSNSLDLGDLQFHTNPINLGVNEFSSKSKTLPKGSGNKKYSISLRNRDYNSLEGAVGGENNNLRSSQDPKSTSKLFEALKENVYTEVTNLITANESRPHFLIQLFRELQLISSDPLRQRTIQSIQELYNRYVESTIIQEENQTDISPRANNSSSSMFLQSPESNQNLSSVLTQQEPFELASTQSTPRGIIRQNHPDAGFVNLIMSEIISAVHAVDYINDSILQKVTNIVFNHVSDNSHDIPSRLMINNDDFLRQLNHWNRTDKDEFITNLENYLNNILVECSNVAANNNVPNAVTQHVAAAQPIASTASATTINDLSINEMSSPNYNGFAIFMDGELAEADQVCSNDENMEEIGEGAVGIVAAVTAAQRIQEQVYETTNNEVLIEDPVTWDTIAVVTSGGGAKSGEDYQNNPNNSNSM